MINPAFMSRREEAALLGDMVIGYGELEITFAHIAGLAINHKYAVLEACHKVRSELGRIDIAHALSHEALDQQGLGPEFAYAESALRYCLKVRNQYAHAQWGDFPDGLKFTNPEQAFSRPLKPTLWKSINLELLTQQERFFENTRMWLIFLEVQLEAKAARRVLHLNKPQEMPQPNLHTPLPTPGRIPRRKRLDPSQ